MVTISTNILPLNDQTGTDQEKTVKSDLLLVVKLLPVLANVVRQNKLEVAADLIDCANFAVGEKLDSLNELVD